MPRIALAALASACLLAPAAFGQTAPTPAPAPAPVLVPAPDAQSLEQTTPDTITPAGKSRCGHSKNVMS